ncbi:General alpha-glucoside permease [Pseudocercospora fuligena]|uniref:General alpha-glucoside permease n=1 Tax=Pseudocercospora fuligena TaxID=685502 RepID=A0A8H6RR75_9PEZI|nr:General alpha-glucoside permease [Pseudocercospora fuligena]
MSSRHASTAGAGQAGSEPDGAVMAEDMSRLARLTRVETLIRNDASQAANAEAKMSLSEGLRLYPKAVAWSMAISTCIVMEGFDLVLINGLYGQPAFAKRFGKLASDGTYQISAAWQSGLSNGALVGEILGLMVVGIVAERIGYRKTLIIALGMITCFIFLLFFAKSLPMLLIGEILCGIPWGAFQTLTTTYASEVCPVALRAYLTTYVNLCWVIGQFLSSGVLKGVADMEGQKAYKIPYGLQWIWPIPLIVVMFLAPESPWWLVRKNRKEEAKKNLLRLTSGSRNPDFDADQTINLMVYTTELERATQEGVSYWDCFKGVNLRRTEIATIVWAIQITGGGYIMGYGVYFYEQAGMSPSNAFSMNLGATALAFVGTICSWFLMGWAGRRTLYFWGQIGCILCLLLAGFMGLARKSNPDVNWGVGTMIMLYTFVYDLTVGPVCYCLVAEISSTRLRNKTVVLARNLYNISGIVANVLFTHQLNPDAWNWGTKTCFFWAVSAAIFAAWTWFRLPEPKGRTYAELDMLFEAKVPARKFKTTEVDAFAADDVEIEKKAANEKTEVVYTESTEAKV